MDSVDFNYYANLGDNEKAAYDFENLILTAGCNFSEIDFEADKAQMSEVDLKRHGYFIHEYIHHTQNFSTNWGSTLFTDFVMAYFKIAASYIDSPVAEIPPTATTANSALLTDGYNGWVSVKDRIKKSHGIHTEEKNALKDIELTEEGCNSIWLDNGKVKFRIGLLAIREHMANLGTLLFWEYTDKQIHDHHSTYSAFLYEEQLTYHPKYWIVFEFFYQNYRYRKTASGLFRLMNECLTRLNPDEAFFRFIRFWKFHPDKLIFTTEFEEFVIEWIKTPEEITTFNFAITETIRHIESRLNFVNTVAENDLTASSKKILENIYQNIVETDGGRNLYATASWGNLKYWGDLITYYGSPIVAFIDEMKIMGRQNYCDTMMDHFVRINSVSMVMKKLHEDREFQCPFLYDVPICKAAFKGSRNCESFPFQETSMDEQGGSCNLRNGVLLLKLEGRMSFN